MSHHRTFQKYFAFQSFFLFPVFDCFPVIESYDTFQNGQSHVLLSRPELTINNIKIFTRMFKRSNTCCLGQVTCPPPDPAGPHHPHRHVWKELYLDREHTSAWAVWSQPRGSSHRGGRKGSKKQSSDKRQVMILQSLIQYVSSCGLVNEESWQRFMSKRQRRDSDGKGFNWMESLEWAEVSAL